MANWTDVVSFIVTIMVLGGFVYAAVFVIGQFNDSVQNTKASLKTKGLDISAKGVSIKTQKRFDREHYVDATQRGFVRAMGASSFGKADAAPSPGPSSAGMYRQASSSGSADFEEKKKRGLFHRGLGSKEKL